jgi:hypothetical protein
MSASAFGPFWASALTSYLTGKTVKAMLVGSGYTFNKDHDFRDDVTSEVSGTGYTSGGIALTSVSVTYDTVTDRILLEADDADFGTIDTGPVAAIIAYVAIGSSATDLLISYHSFTPQTPDAQPFKYQWSTSGVGYLSV